MIEELRIEHLGVIAAASVRPGAGFTALTGQKEHVRSEETEK